MVLIVIFSGFVDESNTQLQLQMSLRSGAPTDPDPGPVDRDMGLDAFVTRDPDLISYTWDSSDSGDHGVF